LRTGRKTSLRKVENLPNSKNTGKWSGFLLNRSDNWSPLRTPKVCVGEKKKKKVALDNETGQTVYI